jgi:hypothetical protein
MLCSRQPAGPISPAVVQADYLDSGKKPLHFRSQHIEIVLVGTEEYHQLGIGPHDFPMEGKGSDIGFRGT